MDGKQRKRGEGIMKNECKGSVVINTPPESLSIELLTRILFGKTIEELTVELKRNTK